jgi:hypothetical protein
MKEKIKKLLKGNRLIVVIPDINLGGYMHSRCNDIPESEIIFKVSNAIYIAKEINCNLFTEEYIVILEGENQSIHVKKEHCFKTKIEAEQTCKKLNDRTLSYLAERVYKIEEAHNNLLGKIQQILKI